MELVYKRGSYGVYNINNLFYPVFFWSDSQVCSIGGRDGHWIARLSESGVTYVSSGSPTRSSAIARISRARKRRG